jgi:putative OPT family oligopeptide transporter
MEFSFRAIIFGMGLALLLGAANAYLGLKVGMTVSASIPAAVISFAILRWVRNANILENNLVQTAASAGESLAAGMIFTLPALILLGSWQYFDYFEGTLLITLGGVLGVLIAVPLRKALLDHHELTFPEGLATAEVLKAGYSRPGAIHALIGGSFIAALVKLLQSGLGVAAGSIQYAYQQGKWLAGIGADLSPALIAVGFIVRLRIASLMFIGGLIVWLFAMPVYASFSMLSFSGSAMDNAFGLWSEKLRFIGVGAMLIAGLWVLFLAIKPVWMTIQISFRERAGQPGGQKNSAEFSMQHSLFAVLLIAIPIAILQYRMIPYLELVIFALVFAILASFLFSTVAAYMAGLVGSSNNPISGVTIATILIAALFVFLILGGRAQFDLQPGLQLQAAGLTIIIGAIVCCAAAIAGDTMQDLKAGQIVGATPRYQTWMQLLGVVAAGLILIPVLTLLYEAYGFMGHLPRAGMDNSQALAAPQASLMQSVALGVFRESLEWDLMFIGMIFAAIIITLDLTLKQLGKPFRIPVMAVAVGMYLPITLSATIFIGGLIAHLLRTRSEEENQQATLFASGLIAGEALIGILLAVPFAIVQDTSFFYLVSDTSQLWVTLLGVLLVSYVCYMLLKSGISR